MKNGGRESEADMINGLIKGRDILLHPICMISLFGIRAYFSIVSKCVSMDDHCFIEILYK